MKKAIPFLFVFLWSTGFIGTKYGLMFVGSGDFLTIRTLLNIIVFALLVIVLKQKHLSIRQIFHAMITGLLIHGAYLAGVNIALKSGLPAGLSAIIVGLQPLLTALLAMIVLKEKLKPIQWAALGLGLAGLMMVVSNSLSMSGISLSAIGFAVMALFGITIGTLYQKKHCQNQPMVTSVFWQYFACAFVFGAMSYYQDGGEIVWRFELIASLAWLVFGLSVAAILLLMYMIEQGDASKVTAYFYLVPPVTALEAWWIFDETLSIAMVVGMAICALSVFLVIRKPVVLKLDENSAAEDTKNMNKRVNNQRVETVGNTPVSS